MARLRTLYRCTECGAAQPKWVGQCPTCQEWSTLVEEVEEAAPAVGPALARRVLPVRIDEVDTGEWQPVPTGIGELDRVLGGGLVPGSVTLLGGEPGIGKSTLLLQAAAERARIGGGPVLLVSAEESAQQVRLRADRLRALAPDLHLLATTSLVDVVAAVDEVGPSLLVLDSVQTVVVPEVAGGAGGVTQVRAAAAALVTLAKERGVAVVLVGHVTKEGGLAGPRVLEHIVDTVLQFEGDRHHALRLLRAVKHRFGPTGELGLFEMREEGMVGVPDASGLFLGDRRTQAPGSIVAPVLDGQRPLLVEVQALAVPTSAPYARREPQGIDGRRLDLLVAVLQSQGLDLSRFDVHASVVGGVRVVEPAVDLAVALAIVSSVHRLPIAPDVVAVGEIGLGGEIRQVAQTPRRLAEAARLGFKRAVVPHGAPPPPPGIETIRAGDVGTAVKALGLGRKEREARTRQPPGPGAGST